MIPPNVIFEIIHVTKIASQEFYSLDALSTALYCLDLLFIV